MDVYTATELAYKNGYKDGILQFVNYLKNNSFLCDPDNRFNFYAINIDNLVEDFLRGE